MFSMVGRNNKAAAINTRDIGCPMEICVGLSLCCLNFIIAETENASPPKYAPAVINFATCLKELVIVVAMVPSVKEAPAASTSLLPSTKKMVEHSKNNILLLRFNFAL